MAEVKEKTDWSILKRIVALSFPYKVWVVAILALALTLAPLRTAAPYIINQLVDAFIDTLGSSIILRWILIYIAVLCIQIIGEYIFVYFTERLGQRVVLDLRTRLFDRMLDFKMRYFDQTPIGKNTTRVISDIETLGLVFTRQGLTMMFSDVLSVIAVLIVMITTSVKLTLICLITMPFMILATYIFKEKVKVSFTRVRMMIAGMNAFLQERLAGMKTVQVFNMERREAKKFAGLNRKYTQANIDTIKYYAIFFPVVEIVSSMALALMIWWGAGDVVKDNITIGVLVAFPMYVNRLFRPIRFLADKFNNVQMAMVAAGRVFALTDDYGHVETGGTEHIEQLKGHIVFDRLYFGYDEAHPVLKGISFEIKSGSTTAFVGATGSGKTSVSNVICKLYDYQKGSATIDGCEIRTLNRHSLRSQIGIVLQDVFLFSGSVLDNIRLRDTRISKEDVIKAAKSISAHEMIMSFPDGYDHVLQERGANLSVGQRQLIAFVRVLVFDPQLLILDEASSSIDTMTEQNLQKAIRVLTKKRTTIIIAHRLATIRHADQIILMDQGRILERGKYEDLLTNEHSHFRKLYEMQFSEIEVS